MQTVPGTISPDGAWYWSGLRWESTLSADGHFRWDGAGWRPAEPDIQAVDPPAAGHRTVRRTLVGGLVFAGIMTVLGVVWSFVNPSGDGPFIAVLAFLVALCQVLALALLVTGRGWRKVMEERRPRGRLSLVLALLLLAGLLVAMFLCMLIAGGASAISQIGITDVRELVLVVLLAVAPATAFIRLTTGGWSWVLGAPGGRQVAAPVLLGLAILFGGGLLLLLFAIGLAQAASDQERVIGVGAVILVLITLVLPAVGVLGLALGREFGRIAATAASIQWALTGVGALVALPLLWLMWRTPPEPAAAWQEAQVSPPWGSSPA